MSSWKRPNPAVGSGIFAQGSRFLVAGALNYLGTIILYQLLLFALPYSAAYVLSWFAGLVFVNLAYPLFVYGKPKLKGRQTVFNTLYYLASFGASWLLLYLFTSRLGVPARLAIILVLAVIVPLNFLVTRYIYRPSRLSDDGGA